MHQWFNGGTRAAITWLSVIIFTIYSFSNFSWNLPGSDFRPFKEGVHILNQKQAEEKASSDAPVSYVMTNKANGEIASMSMDDYLKVYKDYPKSDWDIEQQRGEPAIPSTKISEFEVSNAAGDDMTEALLTEQGYNFMLVSYKMYYDTKSETVTYLDTIFALDTIRTAGTIEVKKRVADVESKEKKVDKYMWDADYVDNFKQVINPLTNAAQKEGIKTAMLTSYADPSVLTAFQKEANVNFPIYTGDDILLKTIIRSNPGIILMKDGKVIKKWHYKKLPPYSEIKSTYMK